MEDEASETHSSDDERRKKTTDRRKRNIKIDDENRRKNSVERRKGEDLKNRKYDFDDLKPSKIHRNSDAKKHDWLSHALIRFDPSDIKSGIKDSYNKNKWSYSKTEEEYDKEMRYWLNQFNQFHVTQLPKISSTVPLPEKTYDKDLTWNNKNVFAPHTQNVDIRFKQSVAIAKQQNYDFKKILEHMLKRSSSRHIRSMHIKFVSKDSKGLKYANKELSDQEVKEKYSNIIKFSEQANRYEKLEFMLTIFGLLRKEITLELQEKEPASELTTPVSKLPKEKAKKKSFVSAWMVNLFKLYKKEQTLANANKDSRRNTRSSLNVITKRSERV